MLLRGNRAWPPVTQLSEGLVNSRGSLKKKNNQGHTMWSHEALSAVCHISYITITPDGNLTVKSPLHRPVGCVGMLKHFNLSCSHFCSLCEHGTNVGDWKWKLHAK